MIAVISVDKAELGVTGAYSEGKHISVVEELKFSQSLLEMMNSTEELRCNRFASHLEIHVKCVLGVIRLQLQQCFTFEF